MKYILLTGHRKSGTTLLHKLFDNHSGLNIYPIDLSLLYAYYPRWATSTQTNDEKIERITLVIRNSTRSMFNRKISASVKSFNTTNFLECFWSTNSIDNFLRPSDIIKGFAKAYCDYANLNPSLPFVFKETSQTVNLMGLIDDGLNIQCVQIIRDPRDNYAAIKTGVQKYYKKMGESEKQSLASVLNRARLDLELALHWREKNPTQFIAIRFEDLVSEPKKTMNKLAQNLQIPWSDSLLQPTFLGSNFKGNNHGGLAFSGISNTNVGKWRQRINSDEAAIIELWMGDVMEKWGYQHQTEKKSQLRAIQDFYAWYNIQYFYSDSFSSIEDKK